MASKQPVDIAPDTMDDLLYVKRSVGGKAKYCGYRREYLAQNLTELEKAMLICKICKGIMKKASIVKGETTCQLCIETPTRLNAVNSVENCVNKLKIKCPLLRDCEWKGKLSEAEKHLNECEHFLVECSYCKQVVTRGNMEIHEQNFCPMREIECEFCEKVGIPEDYTQHLEYCSYYPVACSNGCGEEFPRRSLYDHNSECPLAEVECPYTKYGCKAKPMKRRDLLSHKKEFIIEHVDMVETENRALKAKVSTLEVKVSTLEVKVSTLEVKVGTLESEINTMRREDAFKWKLCDLNKLTNWQTLESVCFYANKYKLKCICKFDSGWIGGSLNFSVQRVAGEFDASLGVAYITECRIILQMSDGTQSCYDSDINYQLKTGNISNVFYHLPNWKYSSFLTPDNSLTILLCFDVRSSPKTLSSELEDTCIPYDDESIDPDPFYFPD